MARVLEPEVMEGEDEATAYDELDRLWGDVIFQGFAESALRMGVRRGRVLDVGTGSGWIAIRLAKLNPELHIEAIDLSRSMIELAKVNARRHRVENVDFSIGDAKRLPFDDHAFDMVICHQLLHQLPEPVVALREIHRVVKPTGALLVRDVRRLPEPLMTLAIPLWTLGYSSRLREQTSASFRAGLTRDEFAALVSDAGVLGGRLRTHGLTHQTVERPAVPYEAPLLEYLPRLGPLTRLMKACFATSPAL